MALKARTYWISAAALLVLIAVAAYAYVQRRETAPTYRELPVERGDIAVTILSTGTVQPENRLEIKPPIVGRVEQVLVAEGQRVAKGQILAWMSSSERAALIDAARAQGPAELKRWEELYRPTPIMAPIAGTIIQRNVESGQTFSATDAVFVMSDRLTVKAQVDETDIAQIRLKQTATIVLDAYPDQSVPAQVDQIAYDAKTVNNVTTYIVDVLPRTTPSFMRSGMTANVTFEVATRNNVLTLANDAIKMIGDNERAVLLKTAGDAKPSLRKIQVGITDGKRSEIIAGLSEGDVVMVADKKGRQRSGGGTNPFSPMSPKKRSGS